MLDRYRSDEMKATFSDQRRFEQWREVEIAVLVGYAAYGLIDSSLVASAVAYPCPSADAVYERERSTRHDVVAFLVEWCDGMPPELASRIHRGLTSSDIVDTAQALILRDAGSLIEQRLLELLAVLAEHALQHRDSRRIGRTHGQHATPDTWGHRVADFALAIDRARQRFQRARDGLLVAKLSGTTGTYQQVPVSVEAVAADHLGLRPVEVATQVVMRDRLAEWMFALASIATVCEAIALEVRLGQRTEVGELAEGGTAGQAGSSSMPHKANPITSEQICGLARLVRAYVNPVLEGVALWHERDLTHSSVERVAVADAAALTEHLLSATKSVMKNLVVNVERMRSRLQASVVSALSNAALVHLTDAGLPWTEAWTIVRKASRLQGDSADSSAFLAHLQTAVGEGSHTLPADWEVGFDEPGDPDLDKVFERVRLLLAGVVASQ